MSFPVGHNYLLANLLRESLLALDRANDTSTDQAIFRDLLNVGYLVVHKNDLHVLVDVGLLLAQIDHLLRHAHRLQHLC